MINLFVVITPIQYVNALELKNYLNLNEEKNILVLISSFYKTRNEIYSMLDRSKWYEVINISNNKASLVGISYLIYLYQSKRKLLNIINQYQNLAKLIIGNYNDLLNHFMIQKVNFDQLYVLDDGLASLDISLNRLKEIEEKKSILKLRRYKKVRPKLAKLILNIEDKITELINFYTAYDLIKNNNDCFITNEYLLLKSNITQKSTEQIAYFIGQPLTELKIVSEEYYFNALNDILRRHKNHTVYYIPHRTEKAEKLNQISIIMDVKNLNLPIEVAVLSEKVLPSIFITFYSSAIINLNIIFGEKFQYVMYKLNPKFIEKGKNNILNFYKNNDCTELKNFELIDL